MLIPEPLLLLLSFLAGKSQPKPAMPPTMPQGGGPPAPAPFVPPSPAPAPLPPPPVWPTPGQTAPKPASMGGYRPANPPSPAEVSFARGLLSSWHPGGVWFGTTTNAAGGQTAYRAEGTSGRRSITVWHSIKTVGP